VVIKRNREAGRVFQKQASALAFGKEVTLQTHGHDKYRRTLGDVILADGSNVNQMLVKDGWCWWYGSMRQEIRCWKG
jgi:endonuclease YncB( thermonuclease family)